MKSCKNCVHYKVCKLECADLLTEACECRLYKLNREGLSLDLRPCIVNGKPALFHRWADWSEIVEPAIMRGGHGGGVVRAALAIVEFKDGTVGRVLPENIRFVALPWRYFDFTEREAKK